MYVQQPEAVSGETLDQIRALIPTLDLAPGPGGSRITPLGLSPAALSCREAFHLTVFDQAMIVALYPSSQLVAHCDPPIAATRLHIPVQINDGCHVFHGGQWQQLETGRSYAMDPTITHGAVNWGTETRFHLVIDKRQP